MIFMNIIVMAKCTLYCIYVCPFESIISNSIGLRNFLSGHPVTACYPSACVIVAEGPTKGAQHVLFQENPS